MLWKIFSIFSAVFQWKIYKLEQIRVRQPHSKRIAEEIGEILTNWDSSIIKNSRLAEDEFVEFYEEACCLFSKLNPSAMSVCAREHLESEEYKELTERYKKWISEGELFLEKYKKFIESSVEELNEWIRKEKCSGEVINKYPIINYCIQKILDSSYSNPKLIPPEGEEVDVILPLNTILMRGKRIWWEAIEKKFIEEFCNSKRGKVLDFYEKYKNLKDEGNKIIEEIRSKIVDIGKSYGLIKGKCVACDE
jgi:hypothetical protein